MAFDCVIIFYKRKWNESFIHILIPEYCAHEICRHFLIFTESSIVDFFKLSLQIFDGNVKRRGFLDNKSRELFDFQYLSSR